jgi:hypothetical protein
MIDLPRRWPRALPDMPIVLLGALAAAALAYLARSMTFWQDEWGSIQFDGGPSDYLRPVNEHWQVIPLLLYRATFTVVGLHSHLPYMAEVIALHLVAVAAAYVLVRRRAGRLVATLACVPLLLLGSGSENLFWAFQTGFVGSVAFGLWALVLVEGQRRVSAAGAAVLLLASLMSSGIGLAFLAAASARAVLDPALRPRTWAIVPPAAAYLAWYLTLGQTPVTGPGHLADATAVPGFVARGIGHAVGSFTGLGVAPRGDLLGVGAFAFALLATAWAVLTMRRPPALAAGALLAIGAMYLIIGVVRAQLPSDFATRSRYVYVAAFLLVIAVADWLPPLRDRTGGRLPRAALSVALSVILVATTVTNVAALQTIRARFQANADLTRAYTALAVTHQTEPWVDPTSVLPGMPSLPDLVAIVRRSGSPTRDDLIPSVARDPGVPAREAALLRMVGSGFRAEPGGRDSSLLPVTVTSATHVAIVMGGPCLSLTDFGTDAALSVNVPTGSRLRLTPTNDVAGRALLGLGLPPSRSIDVALAAAIPLDIAVPDVGDASIWTVRVVVPRATGTIEICRIEGP